MYIDLRETVLQLKALVRLCILQPNSWREVAIGLIALIFAPLIVFICLLSNTTDKKPKKSLKSEGTGTRCRHHPG